MVLEPLSLVKNHRVIQTFSPVKVDNLPGSRKRKRSRWFGFAKESLNGVLDLGLDSLDLEDVVKFFKIWMFEYKDKYVNLHHPERGQLLIRCVSRFSSHYRDIVRARVRKLRRFRFDIKLELTLDPKMFFTLGSQFVFFPLAWNKFRSWIIRKYGRFEFFRVLETTKKGRPHLHVLISFYSDKTVQFVKSFKRIKEDRNYNRMYDDIKAEWNKLGGGHIWLRPIKGKLNLVSYVLKYVNKSLNLGSKRGLEYASLLFASNKRMWSLSHGLKSSNRVLKKKQGFQYLGVVSALDVMLWCRDQGIVFSDFIFLSSKQYSIDPGG